MFCPQCGNEIPDGAAFCGKCGKKIVKPATGAAQETAQADAVQNPQPNGASGAYAASVSPKTPKKSTARNIIIAAVVVALVAVGAYAFINKDTLFGQQGQSGSVESSGDTSSSNGSGTSSTSGGSDSSSDSSSGTSRYADFTVSDVQIVLEGTNAPKITCTVTNNTEFAYERVSLDATGSFKATDSYGDETTVEEDLALICTLDGTRYIPYIMPGSMDVELIPETRDNLVASYASDISAEAQKFTMSDLLGCEVAASDGTRENGNDIVVLDSDDYSIDLTTSIESGTNTLSGTITNNTDDKWESVEVYVAAVGPDGELAKNTKSGYNSVAFPSETLEAEYLKPGASGELSSSGYDSDLNVDHFEVRMVVATKDPD